MPGWQDFLNRFRPAGAPGAAAPRGVPVDRSATAAAELTPLLSRLDATREEADRIRTAAHEQAAQLRRDGSAESAALVERARENVETVAAQAAAQELSAARIADPASDAATEVAQRVAERLPTYTERVVAAARELLAELCAPDSETPAAEVPGR
jgi:hypothetical protein